MKLHLYDLLLKICILFFLTVRMFSDLRYFIQLNWACSCSFPSLVHADWADLNVAIVDPLKKWSQSSHAQTLKQFVCYGNMIQPWSTQPGGLYCNFKLSGSHHQVHFPHLDVDEPNQQLLAVSWRINCGLTSCNLEHNKIYCNLLRTFLHCICSCSCLKHIPTMSEWSQM